MKSNLNQIRTFRETHTSHNARIMWVSLAVVCGVPAMAAIIHLITK